jgi:glycosyltransferase involved in cell wall biosynthesis
LPRAAFDEIRRSGGSLGVMAETGDWAGWRGLARRALSRWQAHTLGPDVSFVLAIGSLGVRWFEAAGFPSVKVYPWAYFVDPPAASATSEHVPSSPPRCCFAGRLEYLKGVDLLLRALGGLGDAAWSLDVVGDGSQRKALTRLAQDLGIAGRIRFLGAMARDRALGVIARSDLLVLPSRRKDGWGAVVNEALHFGVPVVCTDSCGAADLLMDSMRGDVVRSGSLRELTDALARRFAQGGGDRTAREEIRRWSNRVAPGSGAAYLRSVIACAAGERDRPEPPWRN